MSYFQSSRLFSMSGAAAPLFRETFDSSFETDDRALIDAENQAYGFAEMGALAGADMLAISAWADTPVFTLSGLDLPAPAAATVEWLPRPGIAAGALAVSDPAPGHEMVCACAGCALGYAGGQADFDRYAQGPDMQAAVTVSDYTAILAYLDRSYYRWNNPLDVQTPVFVTYSFTETADLPAVDPDNYYGTDGYYEFNAAQKANFRLALDMYEAATGIVFVETPGEEAMINVARTTGSSYGGVASYAYSTQYYTGSGILYIDYADDYDPGNSSFDTVLHEIGHAVGLSHPHEGNFTLDPVLDTTWNTTMSYDWFSGNTAQLGVFDHQALEHLYGTSIDTTGMSWSFAAGLFTLDGSAADNVLFGVYGRNAINGRDGNDVVIGREQNDTLWGGNGDDTLIGNDGDDLIYGGFGNDQLHGANPVNSLYVYDNDTLIGGGGNDWLVGYDGDDSLSGGDGNDTLNGGGFWDLLEGDDGDDVLKGGSEGDTLFGGGGHDRLEGQEGYDSLEGGAGRDTILGGTDWDTIRGGDGSDEIDGGNDNDLIYGDSFGEFGHDTILGGTGYDTIYGASGNDSIDGGAQSDTLDGGNGNDTLLGGAGYDRLIGSLGNDLMQGQEDSDYLSGGNGNDTLMGGLGNDTLIAGNGSDFMDGGAGNDSLSGDYAGQWGNDSMLGGSGNDIMNGGAGNDSMQGGAGRDTLDGGSNNDKLFGDADNDVLVGGAGNDTINGGAGFDYLAGGAGSDYLTGGTQLDQFVFSTADNGAPDTISDFENGIDIIDLTASIVSSFADLTFTQIAGSPHLRITAGAFDQLTIILRDVAVNDMDASDFLL